MKKIFIPQLRYYSTQTIQHQFDLLKKAYPFITDQMFAMADGFCKAHPFVGGIVFDEDSAAMHPCWPYINSVERFSQEYPHGIVWEFKQDGVLFLLDEKRYLEGITDLLEAKKFPWQIRTISNCVELFSAVSAVDTTQKCIILVDGTHIGSDEQNGIMETCMQAVKEMRPECIRVLYSGDFFDFDQRVDLFDFCQSDKEPSIQLVSLLQYLTAVTRDAYTGGKNFEELKVVATEVVQHLRSISNQNAVVPVGEVLDSSYNIRALIDQVSCLTFMGLSYVNEFFDTKLYVKELARRKALAGE